MGKMFGLKMRGRQLRHHKLPLLPVSSVIMMPLQLPAQVLTLQKPGDHPTAIEKGMDK